MATSHRSSITNHRSRPARSARPARTGWGHTNGWSQKLHLFEDGASRCTQSRQREGEALFATLAAALALAEGETASPARTCKECLAISQRTRQVNRAGARILGRAADRKTPFRKGTSRLYA